MSMIDAVLKLRQPMEPIATSVACELKPLPDVGAVIFDIYGTLVISGSGDVGSSVASDPATEFIESKQGDLSRRITRLHEVIQASNTQRQDAGCIKPEINIVDAWRKTLRDCGEADVLQSTSAVVRMAAQHEAISNPTWPMPGAAELLAWLNQQPLRLGIVSNAQVFTPSLVEDLVGGSLADAGFDLNLCVFSNRFLHAKPDPLLFDVLVAGLRRASIQPQQALYVGNDMLNDVYAAKQARLKTAWFAGDKRSCRSRESNPRCSQLKPDLILTDLLQLRECIAVG
ncbi:HAD family hydrolase [Novipirellula sp. SH528]|uniref:HAD family hydrolase n=1 Tax=Novipirellula sp. SH528 TaxID=3454466 RepID=UPI003F9F08D3